ncbi:MAG TPA: hypothetical protein VK817_22240 [Trebonia sp.]|jgi:hypothetical protein|nr:hypothetical protein [Trebonia sp.]
MDSERPAMAPPTTGDARVDEVIAGLASLGELPLDEHPDVLEAVHDRLREILGELGDPGRTIRPGEPGMLGQQGELGSFTDRGAPGEHGEGQRR